MNTHNIILNTDSYKFSHSKQLKPGTTHMSSYIESRGGKWDKTVFFGLQMFLKEYLSHPITQADIEEAEVIVTAHGFEFNRKDWELILKDHKGFLPIEIEAVPEGTVVEGKNVLLQMKNTDPRFPWLTAYVETALLRAIWYPTTVATLSYEVKQILKKYFKLTSDDEKMEGLPFKLHDFGSRGVSSKESAGIGGLAHLVNFQGTDTVESLLYALRYYNANDIPAFSIPASEHSTVTIWGGPDKEIEAHRNMIKQFGKPGALFACVSDSYDIYRVADEVWPALKDEIIESGATIVIRPDSGDPSKTPVEIIQILMRKFGYTTNSKGYRVLPDYIRVIQGDGNDLDTIEYTLEVMELNKLSVDNIAFGMGGGLLQQVNRDTLEFAMKTSSATINGERVDIYKDPVGSKMKVSKKGELALRHDSQGYTTVRKEQLSNYENVLRPVFKNGLLLVEDNLQDIRARTDEC